MVFKTFAALAASLVAVSVHAATITVSYTGAPTPGLAGFNTITVHLHSNQPMQGFDFAGDGSPSGTNSKGFHGPMHQLNPSSISTIYGDNNSAITGAGGNTKQDSQFLVNSGSVTVLPGLSHESSTLLQGIWAVAAPVGTDYDIAQLVLPVTSTAAVSYAGTVSTVQNGVLVGNQVSGTINYLVPEPAGFVLVGLSVVGLVGSRRRK